MNELIATIEQRGAYRVLRRLDLVEGLTGSGTDAGSAVGVVIDVETTGLKPGTDKIIELALRRFRFDDVGVITRIGRAYAWLEDPGFPLLANIVQLTGLTDADLAGKCIDEAMATALVRSADVIIAHNATFDRRFVDARLPQIAGAAWACSCREVDWQARSLDGRGLGWLLAQSGWFHGAHRAGADVDAVIAILQHRSGGTTALAELMRNARRPAWMVRAVGAHFASKDALKSRNYRWDPEASVWGREVADEELAREQDWLAMHVYAEERNARASGPAVTEVNWHTRYT